MKQFVFCDITLCNPAKATDVSEEHIATIFRVDEYDKPETNMAASRSTKFKIKTNNAINMANTTSHNSET
jgi:hypothetical protein